MKALGIKEITIEGCDIELPDLAFDAAWHYDVDLKYGRVEDFEVVGISPEKAVDSYLAILRPILLAKIKDRCLDMEFYGKPAEWAQEERLAYLEAKAEADMEEGRLRERGL